jgi:acyl-CoA synthetase (AMP-forming)/AMP-acid ligase II
MSFHSAEICLLDAERPFWCNEMATNELLPTSDFQIQHGLKYPSFTPAALDGSLTLAEIVQHHARHSKDHVYATYATSNGLREITWSELGAAMDRAARALLHEVQQPTVVAVLANRDTLTYVTLMLGILRAGCTPCLLSPRNSVAGVAHLLKSTKATHIYGSEDETAFIGEVLASMDTKDIKRLDAPLFDDLYTDKDTTETEVPPVPRADPYAVTLYLHSSGSTAFPKPIPFSHIFLLQWVRSPMYGYVDLASQVVGLHAVPSFHASGFYQCIGVPASTGARVAVFPPQNPPVLATPDSVLSSWKETKSTFVITPPSNLVVRFQAFVLLQKSYCM